MEKSRHNIYFIFTLIVFVLAISIRVYWIGQKQAFHADELSSKIYAFGFATKVLDTFKSPSPDTKTYSGRYIKKIIFQKPLKSLKSDIKDLRNNNNREWSHPCLYFVLLRYISEFSNDYTPQNFINYGCGLNLIFFTFSFFIMQKILIRLFGDNKLVPIGLAVAFLNTGAISATLFIRPYELQMLGFILISYVYLIIYDKFINKEFLELKELFFTTIALSFTFLCGYFLWFYVAFLGIILLKHAHFSKRNFKFLLSSLFFSIILTLIFYKGYFFVFKDYLFDNVVSNDNVSSKNCYYKSIFFIKNLIDFLFYKSIIFILLICLFVKKNNIKDNTKFLIILSLIWTYIVALLDPFGVVRYILPAFPILSLLITGTIFKIDNKKTQNILIIFVFLIYLLSAVFPYKCEDKQAKINYSKNYFYTPYGGKLENLFQIKVPTLNSEYKIIVVSKRWYNILYIISTMKDKQHYEVVYLESGSYKVDKPNLEHYYILSDLVPIRFDYKNYNIKKLPPYFLYKCFEVTKKDFNEK